MSLSGGAGRLQQSYEAGKSSYPRTDDRGWTAELDAGLADYAARWQLAGPQPSALFDPAGVSAHPALTPTATGWESVERGVPEWMLSESARMLHVLCDEYHARRTDMQPILEGLPAWAGEVAWARPAQPEGVGVVVSYNAQEVAFMALAEHELARPSTVVEHAGHAVANGLVDEHGITERGSALLKSAPVELTPELSRWIEGELDRERSTPTEHVNAVLAAAPGLEPRMSMALRAYQREEPDEPTGPTMAELIAEYLQERERARDKAQVRAAELPAAREQGARPEAESDRAQLNGRSLDGRPGTLENRDTPPCEMTTTTAETKTKADTSASTPESTPAATTPSETRPQIARLGL